MERKQILNKLAIVFRESRDGKVYSELYNRLKSNLYRYIFYFVKDDDVAKDILSNVFLKLYERIGEYDESYCITTWLYTIAKRECIFWLKKEGNIKVLLSVLEEFNSGVVEDDNENNKVFNNNIWNYINSSIEYKLEKDYEEEDIELQKKYDYAIKVINRLKPMYRDVLLEILLNGMQYKEVAFKYDKELKDICLKYNEVLKNGGTEEIKKIEKQYNYIFNKALQRVKNRVRRGKMIVARELEKKFGKDVINI